MNTPTRLWASASQLRHLQLQLSGLLMEGEDAATLINSLHNCLQKSSWKRFGSGDLEAVADTMREECFVNAEQEIEQDELESEFLAMRMNLQDERLGKIETGKHHVSIS